MNFALNRSIVKSTQKRHHLESKCMLGICQIQTFSEQTVVNKIELLPESRMFAIRRGKGYLQKGGRDGVFAMRHQGPIG